MNVIQHENGVFMKSPKAAETFYTFWENLANQLRHSALVAWLAGWLAG